jgi:hypothetical protein
LYCGEQYLKKANFLRQQGDSSGMSERECIANQPDDEECPIYGKSIRQAKSQSLFPLA